MTKIDRIVTDKYIFVIYKSEASSMVTKYYFETFGSELGSYFGTSDSFLSLADLKATLRTF